MWRPHDWKNPHTPMGEENFVDLADAHFRHIADGKHYAYESGADAILEELIQCGKHTDGKAPTLCINIHPNQSGWVVFIPDER